MQGCESCKSFMELCNASRRASAYFGCMNTSTRTAPLEGPRNSRLSAPVTRMITRPASLRGLLLATIGMLFLSFPPTAQQAAAQQLSVSFQIFYDQLSPYGQWVDYQNYGYVWIPDEGPDFVPYSSRGHWMLSEYGWTWVSDYTWGWAPFHYGRWNYDDIYGWLWVPDTEWGPSWVTWRHANGYYGWAPMRPGISINFSFGSDYDHDRWVFVRGRDFGRNDLSRYHVNRREHDRILRGSSVINRTFDDDRRHSTYIAGPSREDAQRDSRRRFTPVTIQDNPTPGQEVDNGRLRIYRPEIRNANERGQKPAPTRLTDLKDVKRAPDAGRTSGTRTTVQPQRTLPTDNTRPDRVPGTVAPRTPSNDNPVTTPAVQPGTRNGRDRQPVQLPSRTPEPVRPVQPKAITPPPADVRDKQPLPVDPRNTTTRTEKGQQPKATPPVDNGKREQPTRTTPQPLPPTIQRQPQVDRQPQVARPPAEAPREKQPAVSSPPGRNNNTARPQAVERPTENTVRPQRPIAPPQTREAERAAQPRVAAPPANRGRQQQPSVRPPANDRGKQTKQSKADDDRKRKD